MRNKTIVMAVSLVGLVALIGCGLIDTEQKQSNEWAIHDMDRPRPAVVTPGDLPGQPPSDAIILFDGTDLSQWLGKNDQPAKWKVENGYMEVNKTGTLRTKQSFGDCQLHVEWATPSVVKGTSQKRGNSGIKLMSRYEVQILDSYDNVTYADGQAASIYGQYPPLVNASRKPGQWQTYDIVFHAPRFDKQGQLIKPARVTVLHNNVLVQNHVEIRGATAHKKRGQYKPHPDKLPFTLQDHNNPVRYRNIWIRKLNEND